MDCKTARLLLDYLRPNNRELDAAETRALEDHLTACDDCGPLSRGERRADEIIGRAMRQVDVPDQLRGRLLARLEERRGDHRRVWRRYGVRAFAAAAALLLLVLGLWHWYAVRPAFPAVQLLTDANNIGISPPDQKQVDATLKGQGFENAAPDYNYNHLSWLFLANVEGRQTPLMLFNDRGARRQALVYVLPDTQFDLNALPPNPNAQAGNEYEYKCAIDRRDHYAYVVYYTGDDPDWLQPVRQQPGTANGN